MAIKLFGITNCNTVKKARDWLESNHIPYEFVDFKKQEPTSTLIQEWLKEVELDVLLNRKGTTWRQLTDEQKSHASTPTGAIELMMAKPSVIKRPVIQYVSGILVGFDETNYASLLR